MTVVELEFKGKNFDPQLEFKTLTQYSFHFSTVSLIQFPSGLWGKKSLDLPLFSHLAHLKQ